MIPAFSMSLPQTDCYLVFLGDGRSFYGLGIYVELYGIPTVHTAFSDDAKRCLDSQIF